MLKFPIQFQTYWNSWIVPKSLCLCFRAVLGSPTAMTCGSPANNKLACTFVVAFIIIAKLICQADTLGINVSNTFSCVSEAFIPSPLGDISEGISNGLVAGAKIARSICPGILATWYAYLNAKCPGSFDTLILILETLFPTVG